MGVGHTIRNHRMRTPPLTRREALKLIGTTAAGLLPGCAGGLISDNGLTASAAILRAAYDPNLADVIEAGLQLVPPPDVAGRRVLLKPNLVDLPRDNKPIITDPRLLVAAAEAFRRRGAAEVIIADGPALQRDAWQIVDAVGHTPLLAENGLTFVDLKTHDVVGLPNLAGMTGFDVLYFARTVVEADVLVSMPKMKVHHWAGASLSMKNLFGTLPGAVYGWPRNAFHLRDLNNAVIDFNTTRPADYAIIDGIVGLEGDGPVRGTPIDVGVLVMGFNPTAVDATATRVMGLGPDQIRHLRLAAGTLGPVGEENIEQRGEPIAAVQTPFNLIASPAALVV